jgi:hypothetical protein
MRGETLLDHSASLEDGSPPVIGCSAALSTPGGCGPTCCSTSRATGSWSQAAVLRGGVLRVGDVARLV